MWIIVGIKYFELAIFTSSEVDIDFDGIVEVRQPYFHFFWIPIVGPFSNWYLHKNGNYYKLPIDIYTQFKKKNISVRKKWYANFGIIAILCSFFIFYPLFLKYEEYTKEKQKIESIKNYEKWIRETEVLISNPKIGSTFQFYSEGSNSEESNLIAEVHNMNNDSICLTILVESLNDRLKILEKNNEIEKSFQFLEESQSIYNRIKTESINLKEKKLYEYQNFPLKYKFIWVSKKELLNSLKNNVVITNIFKKNVSLYRMY